MAPILAARGSGVFPPADPVVVNGNTKPVPGCSTVSKCRSVLTAAGFQTSVVRVDSDKKEGELVGTSPPRGGRAVAGQLVSILVSNGADYVEPTPTPTPEAPAPTSEAPAGPTVAPAVPPEPGAPGPPTGPGAPAQGTSSR
jgi:hypothetical protein